MIEFISAWDAAEGASYNDQKVVRDEVADILFRLRRAMDAGLTPEEMKTVRAEKEAAEAAETILETLFK